MKPFVTWKISDDEDIKLVLGAGDICQLEDKLNAGNLVSVIGNSQTGMPSLKTMLTVVQQATNRYNHGIKMADVYAMYDRYIDNGGSQVDFYTDVYVNIFSASGFFPKEQASDLTEKLEEMK